MTGFANGNTEDAGADPAAIQTSDEQFEETMSEFTKRLEADCNVKVAEHARKLKPNYDGHWICKLKL